MPKKLLIVSHVFPPAPGIGGRRWAKFAKYLKRKGYDLTILTSENVSKSISEWTDDAKDLRIETLPFRFPKVVSNPGKSILSGISYFIWVKLLKLVEHGNYFDKTIFWRRQVQKNISEIIVQQNIECVIVTGGPFRLTNYVIGLNKKFPNVKFIADFRDLWTEDSEITFFSVMSENRKRIEKKIEKETILQSDKVIATMDSIADYFSTLTIANKFTTISNGYDPDDFISISEDEENSGKIIFVYAGTLYINLQYILIPLFKAIGELKKNKPELYKKIEFRFIGKFPHEYEKHITENNISEAIKILNFLPLKETLTKIKQANYGVLILNDVYNFNLSTKFFEYISQKKKVVVVSNEGSASKFIVENKLGIWLNPKTGYEDLIKLIKDTEDKTLKQWDSTFDIEQFSINSLTDKLIQVIEEPFNKGESLYTRNLLFTFDYELFLGKRSGTVENCILKPTEKILELFSKYQITKAIFFVDTTYLKKLTESSEAECQIDLAKIKKQLVDLLQKGHYIFPHLHPHWRDAVYEKDIQQWRLEKTDAYRFHAIPEEERSTIFSFSINLIKEIKKMAGVSYNIDSYRAGGWCLQPFNVFKPYFEKYGIKNDFSALRGSSLEGKNIHYDYTNIPAKNIYKFSNAVVEQDKNGEFNEFVITSLTISNTTQLLNKFLNKYLWYTKKTGYGDGYSAVDSETTVINSARKFKKQTKDKTEMASIELLTYFTLPVYKEALKENDFMHFISHPKMISEHNLSMLEEFLKYAANNYKVNMDYNKMIS